MLFSFQEYYIGAWKTLIRYVCSYWPFSPAMWAPLGFSISPPLRGITKQNPSPSWCWSSFFPFFFLAIVFFRTLSFPLSFLIILTFPLPPIQCAPQNPSINLCTIFYPWYWWRILFSHFSALLSPTTVSYLLFAGIITIRYTPRCRRKSSWAGTRGRLRMGEKGIDLGLPRSDEERERKRTDSHSW